MPLTRRTTLAVAASVMMALWVAAAPLLVLGMEPESWRFSARYAARLAFVLFMIPFLAPVWIARFDVSAARDAFLALAAAHFIHLGALGIYRYLSNQPPEASAIVVGGAVYVMLLALTITLLMGGQPGRFMTVVLHAFLLVAAITYGYRIPVEETRVLGIVGVAVCGVALALRHGGRVFRHRFEPRDRSDQSDPSDHPSTRRPTA